MIVNSLQYSDSMMYIIIILISKMYLDPFLKNTFSKMCSKSISKTSLLPSLSLSLTPSHPLITTTLVLGPDLLPGCLDDGPQYINEAMFGERSAARQEILCILYLSPLGCCSRVPQ